MDQELDDNLTTAGADAPLSAASGATTAPGEETVRIRVKERTRVRTGKKRSHKRRGPKARTVAIAVLCAVLILVVCGAAAFAIMKQQGQQNMAAAPANQEDLTAKDKGKDYVFNDNVVAVLFEGIDDESGYSDKSCSDANFLLTLDTSTNDVVLTVVPRDAECEVDIYQNGEYAFTSETNLCLAYAQDADKKTCAKNVVTSVSSILGDMPIKYYFAMNVHAIETLADAVGGVKVKALQSIPNSDIAKGKEITLKGENAYKYVQYRDTSVDESALDRQARQKQFLEALFSKAKGLSVTELVNVVGTVSDYSVTNIGASELSYLASVFLAGGKGNVQMNTITGKTKTKVYEEDGLEHEYIVLDKKSVKAAKLAAYYTKVAD